MSLAARWVDATRRVSEFKLLRLMPQARSLVSRLGPQIGYGRNDDLLTLAPGTANGPS